MSNLKDKVVIVTGASSGIGEATAVSVARAGADVVIVARRKERLAELSRTIKEETGKQALEVVGDVSEYATAENAIKMTIERFSRLDVLVNNAGVMYVGPVAGAVTEDWKKMFDTNVLGLMYFTHAAIPHMKERKDGHIINISSVSGRVVSSRSAVYSATKFAVNAFSDGIRQELSKNNIRVTIIEPGAVTTELTDHIKDESTKEAVKNWVASMRALTSEDIAASIVYAASQPSHVNVNEILIRPTDQSL